MSQTSNSTWPFLSSLRRSYWKARHFAHAPADLVLVQDSSAIVTPFRRLSRALRDRGHDARFAAVDSMAALKDYLEALPRRGRMPRAFFLDSVDVGFPAGVYIRKWFAHNRPEATMPEIHMLSSAYGLSVEDAKKMRFYDAATTTRAIKPSSLCDAMCFMHDSAQPELGENDGSEDDVFYDLLNRFYGLGINSKPPAQPEDADYDEYFRRRLTNDLLEMTKAGILTRREALEALRPVAERVINDASWSGNMGSNDNPATVSIHARFYDGTGAPFIGPAAFDMASVNRFDHPPILVARDYHPIMSEMVMQKRISGIITLSMDMADHLKTLCDISGVAGAFGLIPDSGVLPGDMNFRVNTAIINGYVVEPGQMIGIGLPGHGICVDIPDKNPSAVSAFNKASELRGNIYHDMALAKKFNWLAYAHTGTFSVIKANVATPDDVMSDVAIGLVRTEQGIFTDSHASEKVKTVLLGGFSKIGDLRQALRNVHGFKDRENATRYRLMDLNLKEVMTQEQQRQFIARHGRLDIRGGAALSVWTEFYRQQVSVIAERANSVKGEIEIMMPAIETGADVAAFTALAREAGSGRCPLGVMIETRPACDNIAEIAPQCDFISFGTNDLTAAFYNLDRGDLRARHDFTVTNGYDPFVKLSPEVFDLMRGVIAAARAAKPSITIDVCGAQAVNPDTAVDLLDAGINHISVAPTRENLAILPLQLIYRRLDRVALG